MFLASSYGLTPDPWQAAVIDAWLRVLPDGRWAATTCGLAVPRQNGKNGILEVRELFGMVVLGERFLHTAHEVKTARKAFLRLASFFENPAYPELGALVAEIRKTNGQEAVVLTNGGQCEFIARSKSSGRGYTVDVLVMDEAQELGDEALEALMPTASAGPLGNPQYIYTGTPPGPKANGEVFTRLREDGVAGKNKRAAWHEWSVEPPDARLSDAEQAAYLDDERNLARANPALGYRLQYDVAATERAAMSDDGYGRERLGIWSDDTGNSKIPRSLWSALADPLSGIDGRLLLGVAMPLDQLSAVIGAAGERSDGLQHIEVVEQRRGSAWVAARVRQLELEHGADGVVIDPGGPAGILVAELEAAGVNLIKVTAREYAQGCGALYATVTSAEPTVRHLAQSELDAAVAGAKTRTLGDLWAWARKDATVDIAPLEAVNLAWLVLLSTDTQDPAANVW